MNRQYATEQRELAVERVVAAMHQAVELGEGLTVAEMAKLALYGQRAGGS